MASLYDISIPVLSNVLRTTRAILKEGEGYAKEKQIATQDLLSSRIYEDMFPLTTQVILIVGTTKKAVERLTGTAPKNVEGRDKNLEELYAIISEALNDLEAVSRDSIDGKAAVEVPCKFGPKEMKANLVAYIQGYTMPNAYFHLSTAYAILRGKGVPLGKTIYLNEFIKDFGEA